MPPKTTHPLEQHVCGREIGHDEIEVDVHALFYDLSCYQHRTHAVIGALLAKTLKPITFQFLAPEEGKSAVEDPQADGSSPCCGRESSISLLGFDDRVAQ